MHSHPRRSTFLALSLSFLLITPAFSMDVHLSEEAVREAYFLGQRHDESMGELLAKYVKSLPPPQSGPYITSVTFYTPYALAVFDSSQHNFNYDAQDAELDHRKQPEIVRVDIQISLTDSYGPYIMKPTNSRYASPIGIGLRSGDFWKDFRVRVFSVNGREETQVWPVDAGGYPFYSCDGYGGCVLTGAAIHFDYPAESFASDCAAVRIDPPEGDTVAVEFDLSTLR
jgi:hypothetical protein